MKLVVESNARAAAAVTLGVPPLDNEVIDHTMKRCAVVEIRLGQFDDSSGGSWNSLLKHFNGKYAKSDHRETQAAIAFGNKCCQRRIIAGREVRERLTFGIGTVQRGVEGGTGMQSYVADVERWSGEYSPSFEGFHAQSTNTRTPSVLIVP